MTSQTPVAQKYADYGRSLLRRIFLTREMAIIGLFVLVVIVAIPLVPHFVDVMTVYNSLRYMTTNLMIALPMAMVMITGDIDVSVGSIVGLTCSLLGLMYSKGVPFGVGMVIVILVGAACGLLNGLLVTKVGLPALAVTIGSMALFRGIAVGLLGTTTITGFPTSWTAVAKWAIGGTGIPVTILVFLLLVVIFVALLHFTSFGRGVFAIGLNKQAAAFSGVNIGRTRLILFVLIGTVSSFGGIYWTLQYSTARGDVGTGLELQVIAAVVLGGVSVFGGRGKLHGVIFGVLLIGVLSYAMQLAGYTGEIINVITGLLLIGSVVVASVGDWARSRRPRAVIETETLEPTIEIQTS